MSDHQEAKQATPPETLLAELLDSRIPKSEREHAAKREIERLTASLKRANETAEHFERHWYLRGDEIERLRAERDELRDVLLRGGFVPCDIPACNCGSWHHRYGLPERMQEIKDELAEAGHELSNANGNLTLNALKALVAERDELRRQLAEAELDAERYRWLAGHCRTSIEHWGGRWSIIVDGPVPKAHDSENAFDAAIDAAMGSNMTDALKEPRDQR